MAKKNGAEEGNSSTAVEALGEAGSAYLPDVDILAEAEGLRLLLDLPGVSQGGVHVEVDENFILTITARNGFAEPEGPVARQFGIGNYRRVFQLGEEFDRDKVKARLEDGVLSLEIPKREDAKPRRIAIQA